MSYVLVPIKRPESVKIPDFSEMTSEELLNHYDKAKAWLIKHASQTGTQNLFDVNGNPYDPDMYSAALKLLEMIEDEGRRREITPFIPNHEIEEIFGAKLEYPSPISVANERG